MVKLIAEQNKRDEDRIKVEKFFPVQTLGWGNCDQLYDLLERRIQQSAVTTDIPTKTSDSYSIRLTFPKLGMVIQGYANKEQVSFGSLPKGLDGYMVGMKTENNQPYLAIQKIKTDNMKVALDFKPVTAAEIKKAFSELK